MDFVRADFAELCRRRCVYCGLIVVYVEACIIEMYVLVRSESGRKCLCKLSCHESLTLRLLIDSTKETTTRPSVNINIFSIRILVNTDLALDLSLLGRGTMKN
jgi:hypothetical protein